MPSAIRKKICHLALAIWTICSLFRRFCALGDKLRSLTRVGWHLVLLSAAPLLAAALLGCGPDKRSREAWCDGPSFNLVVTAEGGLLPPDTHINVRYGSNQDGEPYTLGQPAFPQAVFCEETSPVTPAGEGGASSAPEGGVQALRCRLFTQGPAHLDATATGYETIDDLPLSFETDDHCQVEVDVQLERELPDGGQ